MNLQELIQECKQSNPKLFANINNDIVELVNEDYENACLKWAEMRLQQITDDQAKADKQAEAEAKAAQRATALAKLEALGLDEDDLKALGL